MYRFGIGYDIHPLVKGRRLTLGGVTIPFHRGLRGHSDADVLVHAIADALVGALGADDIGKHFPNTDMSLRGISSVRLLERVSALVRKSGYRIINIDSVVIMERPTISPYKEAMKKVLSRACAVKSDRINIKATTNEGMDSIGKGKAAAAFAIALLRRAK